MKRMLCLFAVLALVLFAQVAISQAKCSPLDDGGQTIHSCIELHDSAETIVDGEHGDCTSGGFGHCSWSDPIEERIATENPRYCPLCGQYYPVWGPHNCPAILHQVPETDSDNPRTVYAYTACPICESPVDLKPHPEGQGKIIWICKKCYHQGVFQF